MSSKNSLLADLDWPWIAPNKALSKIQELGLGSEGGVDGRALVVMV